MDITAEILEKSVAGIPFGDAWPFTGSTTSDTDGYHKRMIAHLERSRRIKVRRHSDYYGSGYASYIHLLVYERDGHSTHDRGAFDEIVGLNLYLSRLSPFGVYGPGFESKSKDGRAGSHNYIEMSTIYRLPEGDWEDFLGEGKCKLTDSGIVFPSSDHLSTPLPVKLDIPTIWDPPYSVFDAIFYWTD